MNFSFLQTSMNNNAYDQKGANMNPGKKKPSILIAGAHGFVGSRAMEYYPTAIPVPSELLRDAGTGLIHFIQTACPDIIINAADISDIRTCENHPEDSYAANVKLPEVLTKAARQSGAKLISFSSDQVYTGCRDHGPYQENSVSDTGTSPHNLWINTDRIQKQGIHFDTTVQGFRRCLEDYPILRHPFLPPSR